MTPHRIDVHHHVLPKFWIEAAHDHKPGGHWPAPVTSWTPGGSIAQMDAHAIAGALVSLGLPGVWWGDDAAARDLARRCNEYAAGMARDYPGRFGFFATMPMPDVDATLAEMAYALDVLGADGIGFLTSYGDRWPGHAAFEPVWAELDRRGAVAYFHPTIPACCQGICPDIPTATIEYVFDTTRAITNLLCTGTLSRYPSIRYIFSHAGGTIPMLAGRIAHVAGENERVAARLPHGVIHELRRLRFELASSLSRPTFAALRAFTPLDQILLGTDFPYVPMDLTTEGLEAVDLDPIALAMVERDNALRLFPRFR